MGARDQDVKRVAAHGCPVGPRQEGHGAPEPAKRSSAPAAPPAVAASTPPPQTPRRREPSEEAGAVYGWRTASAGELRCMISNELSREDALAVPVHRGLPPPCAPPAAADGACCPAAAVVGAAAGLGAGGGARARAVVVSWLSEVAAEFEMQQETLFLAVALFDAFAGSSRAPVPCGALQLVGVACLMTAGKQEEASHPTVEQLTEIAAGSFRSKDLLRMERLLLDQLDWRIKRPTAYSFLHLITLVLPARLPADALALAMYLCELSLLDPGMLVCRASAVASAALVASTACCTGAAPGARVAQEIARLTGAAPDSLAACAARLLDLHCAAACAGREAAACTGRGGAHEPFVQIRQKYATAAMLSISLHPLPSGARVLIASALGLGGAV